MKKGYTDIVVLLDRSGSMSSIKEDMMGGFNTFLKEQKKLDGECTISLYSFDENNGRLSYDTIYREVPIKKAGNLNDENFVPRGMTPLLDAMGKLINETGNRYRGMNSEDRPERIVLVIITDGLENASREFKKEQINKMVQHQEDKYSWNFIYLGANQDAIAEGQSMGFSAKMAMTYEVSKTRMMYSSLSKNIANFRKSAAPSKESLAFTEEQRKESGKKS
ncbi:vWA domain-containing protein [Flexithrix dorotheae]|uniref:vWA domain-containing protein n=1 Tax=Flexithrix dorotheae TaxID=70993 RepID=UPI0003718789|nr:vWA domain-containing protein [Flexithrix dorotheae]